LGCDFQVTLAHLKDKPTLAGPAPSSSASTSSGVRYAAARLLGVGGGNGGRTLNFVGGNGTSKAANGTSRSSSLAGSNDSHSMLNSNYDGKGTYLIFNVGDTLFISDLNSQDKVIGCHWGCGIWGYWGLWIGIYVGDKCFFFFFLGSYKVDTF
jgi:hypothetical protein